MNVTIITRKDEMSRNIEAFEDGRVREVYEIVLSDYFYNNIITKGYMAFDAEQLLSIGNSISRSIFTMVEKWRGYELYLKRPIFFIARRVPLKWNKNQIKRTVDTIEKALIELKQSNLIDSYRIIKEKKWELAEVEITFLEDHNKTKRETFFTERNEFHRFEMVVTDTEERFKESSKGDLNDILHLFPKRVLEMKTFESFIKNAVVKYGYDYVVGTAEYTIRKKPNSYKSYMAKALEGNWADEYISKKNESKNISKPKELSNVIEEAKIVEKYSYEDFEKLSDEEKQSIVLEVYKNFLEEAHAKDNKTMRGIFEKSKKGLIIKYINENEINKLSEEVLPTEEKEIVFENITDTKFLLEVSTIMRELNINFDLLDVATIFKIYGKFEDETVRIVYNNETKIGRIEIKGGNK